MKIGLFVWWGTLKGGGGLTYLKNLIECFNNNQIEYEIQHWDKKTEPQFSDVDAVVCLSTGTISRRKATQDLEKAWLDYLCNNWDTYAIVHSERYFTLYPLLDYFEQKAEILSVSRSLAKERNWKFIGIPIDKLLNEAKPLRFSSDDKITAISTARPKRMKDPKWVEQVAMKITNRFYSRFKAEGMITHGYPLEPFENAKEVFYKYKPMILIEGMGSKIENDLNMHQYSVLEAMAYGLVPVVKPNTEGDFKHRHNVCVDGDDWAEMICDIDLVYSHNIKLLKTNKYYDVSASLKTILGR